MRIPVRSNRGLGIAFPHCGSTASDKFKFLVPETRKIGLGNPPLVKQAPKHPDEDRVSIIVLLVELTPLLRQEIVNAPDFVRISDSLEHGVNFLSNRYFFPQKSSVESGTSDLLLSLRPIEIARIGRL
jgi:hypothetical protein